MKVDLVARVALTSFAVLLPTVAQANPWDLYGFNARAIGMGGAQVAVTDDYTAVFYNPAALTIATDAKFGFGFDLARPQLELQFDKADRSIAEVEPPSSNGVTFGALFPLGGEGFKNRVALGLAVNVPTGSLLSGQALDPATPHWYMYQSLPRRIVAALGVGASPWEWLSLGVSVQILAGVVGRLDYELDVVAGQLSRKSVEFEIKPSAAPIAGFEIRPWKGLRFGFSYRSAIDTQVDLPVDLVVTGVADLTVTTFFTIQYTPHQFSVGISYEYEPLDLTLGLDIAYALWSKAPDPSVNSRIDIGGELFEGTGLDDALDAPAPGRERAVDLGFRDVVVPRIGVEKRFGFLSVRGGYALRPSPAPVQTSGTNYVDGTTHVFGLGAGARFHDPLRALDGPIVADAGASLHFLPQRGHPKITQADPVGGYRAGGLIWVFGVSLKYAFGVGPAAAAPAAQVLRPTATVPAPLGDPEPAGQGDPER